MKPAPFAYHDPATLAEAVGLLSSLDNAKILAGGQSLMPMLNMRYAQPDHVVDLNRVDGLAYIRADGDGLEIGAMTRQRKVEASAEVARLCPLLAEAMPLVGHRQTRNRGTVGGSLAHMDSSAEIPTVCAALDATLTVEGPAGRRDIAFADFPAGYLMTALGPDDLLVSIRLPAWGPGHGYAFTEFARRHGDFAIVSVAALIDAGADGRIARAAVTIGGAGPAPVRVAAAEEALMGADATPEAFEAAAKACRGIEAHDDVHGTAAYRRHLAGVLAARAMRTAWARTELGGGAAR